MSEVVKLFPGGGCSQKFDLRLLIEDHLSELDYERSDVFLGFSELEDVGALRMGSNRLLVQSIDIIAALPVPPVDFGEICVAHCLSDLLAKGARPSTALTALFCEIAPYDKKAISAIFKGLSNALRRADVALLGGHTIVSSRLYCGLSVSGFGAETELVRKSGARTGDVVVLTKPLGTGVLAAAAKHELVPEMPPSVLSSMKQLNDLLLDPMLRSWARAATDVTGAGLAGALCDLARQSSAQFYLESSAVPVFEEARELAESTIEDGSLHNRRYCDKDISFAENVGHGVQASFFAPETSGGLLITLPGDRLDEFRSRALQEFQIEVSPIGEVTGQGAKAHVAVR